MKQMHLFGLRRETYGTNTRQQPLGDRQAHRKSNQTLGKSLDISEVSRALT